MSMVWDYISELRPPMEIILSPRWYNKHGEPWWNDIGRGKLLIHPPGLSGNQSGVISWQIRRNWWKMLWIWPSKCLCSYFGWRFTCRKIVWHRAGGCASTLKEGVLRILIALKNPSSLVGIQPANLRSNGKHASHYTTDNDKMIRPFLNRMTGSTFLHSVLCYCQLNHEISFSAFFIYVSLFFTF
jgi:hypothetical protein